MEFRRYVDSTGRYPLENTSIDDIPQDEQDAWWESHGGNEGNATDAEVDALYAAWYEAQEAYRRKDARAPWIICPTCSGDGWHSRNLGSFTREEFDYTFSPDEQDAYIRGEYDSLCQTCEGTGKVRSNEETWRRHNAQLNYERGCNEAGEPW